MRKLLLNKWSLLLLLAIAGGGYFYWQKTHQTPAGERYKTQAVEYGNVSQTVSANGTLNPVVLVSVGTQVSGTVKKLYADFNGRVRQGQILMELDASLFQAQVRQSEANVANAEAALELASANETRSRGLYAKEYVSKQELDQSTQALKSARAKVALATASSVRRCRAWWSIGRSMLASRWRRVTRRRRCSRLPRICARCRSTPASPKPTWAISAKASPCALPVTGADQSSFPVAVSKAVTRSSPPANRVSPARIRSCGQSAAVRQR